MKTLKFDISCGEKTCAHEKGKFCRFFGSRRFGTIPCCVLFPTEDNSFTELETGDDGWVLRCNDCLETESKQPS